MCLKSSDGSFTPNSRLIERNGGTPPSCQQRTSAVYFARSKVTILRVIPLSAQFGITRHGVNTCS
jgi:hypothetical protein